MTTDIEPGDLIRERDGRVSISEHAVELGFAGWRLIAKGPGWIKHDGSSVNPVPGAECEVLSGPSLCSKKPSETWTWPDVKFYRVTREAPAPVEAPAAPLHIHMPGPDPERPTLRDQFAMAALTGLLAAHDPESYLSDQGVSDRAYAIAGAMMKERRS